MKAGLAITAEVRPISGKSRFRLTLIAVGMLASIFASDVQSQTAIQVEGYVRDVKTNAPIPNASVQVKNPLTGAKYPSTPITTSGAGYYSISQIPWPANGTIVVFVTAQGYNNYESPSIHPNGFNVVTHALLLAIDTDGTLRLKTGGYGGVSVTFPGGNVVRITNNKDAYFGVGVERLRGGQLATVADINTNPLLTPRSFWALGWDIGVQDIPLGVTQTNDQFTISLVSGAAGTPGQYETVRTTTAGKNMEMIVSTLLKMLLVGYAGDLGGAASEIITKAQVSLEVANGNYAAAAVKIAQWVFVNKEAVAAILAQFGVHLSADAASAISGWMKVGMVFPRFVDLMEAPALDQIVFEKTATNQLSIETDAYPIYGGYWGFRLPFASKIEVKVKNNSATAYPNVWVALDIRDPFGRKIENTKTPITDPETGRIGALDFVAYDPTNAPHEQGVSISPGSTWLFRTRNPYDFSQSVTGHIYRGGNYTYEYAVWVNGYPGQSGASKITSLRRGTIIIRDTVPPNPVRLFDVHYADAGTTIALSWEKVTQDTNGNELFDMDYYWVYRSASQYFGYTLLGMVDVDELQNLPILYKDSTITPWNCYYYMVVAVDTGGNYSAISPAVFVTPNPRGQVVSLSPNPATQGQSTIVFTGSGDDPDNVGTPPEIRLYRWISDPGKTDGNTELYSGPNASFSLSASNLCVGNHTITLYVQDNEGEWSAPATFGPVTVRRGNTAPTASVVSITPNPATQGQGSVTFTGTGTDPDGLGSPPQIRVYCWSSDRGKTNGQLELYRGPNASFFVPASDLKVGTHVIRLTVQDNDTPAEWSAPATFNSLSVRQPGGATFGAVTLNDPLAGSRKPVKTGDPVFIDLSWDFSAATSFPDAQGVAFNFRLKQGTYSTLVTWQPYKTRIGRNTFRITTSASAPSGDYDLAIDVVNLATGLTVLSASFNGVVNLSSSNPGVVLPQPAQPNASLFWAGRNNVRLTWNYGNYGQTEFRFERSVNGGPFGRVHWLDCHGQAVKVDDETVEPGKTYAYRFQARINDSIVSAFSQPVSIPVPAQFLPPPDALVYPTHFPGMSIYQAMESAKSQGKNEMYLQPTEHIATGPFGFPGDFALIGGGSGNTTIRSGIIMGLNGGGHMRLAGVRLLNPGSHSIGLELYQVGGGVTLEDVTIDGFPTGVKVDRTPLDADGFECKAASSKSLFITNNGYASVHIKNGNIHNNPGNGIEAGWTNADLLVEDTLFTWNGGKGAEIVASQGTYEFRRCVFSHNTSHGFSTVGSTVRIRNCVAYSNSGAGFYISGSGDCRNCIAFSNGAEGITGGPWYCLSFGNTGGDIYPDEYRNQVGNNIIADPKFVSPASGDFHLLPDSPAIDSGDPADAYDQEPEPNGNRINMGNYGNTPAATVSLDVTPAAPVQTTVTPISGTEIRVSWRDASDNESGFRIERRIQGGQFQVIRDLTSPNSLTSGTVAIVDRDLFPVTTYDYKVTAYNARGARAGSVASTATLQAIINHAPRVPSNLYPFAGQTGVLRTTVLVGSAFSDPDAGDTHSSSRFQIRADNGSYTVPVWDSGGTTSGLTIIQVPQSGLDSGRKYWWRCQYKDSKGTWGLSSGETPFTISVSAPTRTRSWTLYR